MLSELLDLLLSPAPRLLQRRGLSEAAIRASSAIIGTSAMEADRKHKGSPEGGAPRMGAGQKSNLFMRRGCADHQ